MFRTLVILGLNLSKIGSIEGPDTFITNTYLKNTHTSNIICSKQVILRNIQTHTV